ncbi:unnamed protein product [Pleuronectes platessa]|uniref:Uncharacterized protein n=1 Tax=Pleuronectes platessa TaxID=8262 RepID=A0A9N7UEY2_PLEPL|nr:unnamed protein product [Pleuronectes platessa]
MKVEPSDGPPVSSSSSCPAPLLHPEMFVFLQFHVHTASLGHVTDVLPGGCRRRSRKQLICCRASAGGSGVDPSMTPGFRECHRFHIPSIISLFSQRLTCCC